MNVSRSTQYLCTGLMAILVSASALCVPPPYTAGGYPNDPFGDLNNDGAVNAADVALMTSYIGNPSLLTQGQQERVRRYGDISNVLNANAIGNGVVDAHDVARLTLLAGGVIDPGTAGVVAVSGSDYGDVNNDGVVNMVDAVIVQRRFNGISSTSNGFTATQLNTRISTAGLGDVSPTKPTVRFGDGVINAADLAALTLRANGAETTRPAYVDYWPMLATDTYRFNDLAQESGDANFDTMFVTSAAPLEVGGYSVTEVAGNDGDPAANKHTLVGVYKGMDGSIYAMYVRFPMSFGGRRIDFQSPVKVLDATAAGAGSGSWTGTVPGFAPDYGGRRQVPFTSTVLKRYDTYTPAAGSYPTGDGSGMQGSQSRWSKTVQVRLDVALLASPINMQEYQQALFFDFTPFIGVVRRGQNAARGTASPDTVNKPYLELTQAQVRGIVYNQSNP